MENWKEYIQPGLLVLVPVLSFIDSWLKRAEWFADKYIPAVLGAIGIVLALLYTLSVSQLTTRQQVLSAVFTAATQGIACAGASVYAHQLMKQSKKDE